MSTSKHVIVDHLSDGRFSIQMGDHQFEVEQHRISAPLTGGPGPTELFVASLASCVAFYARGFLQHYGLADRFQVSARWSVDSRPMRIAEIVIEIDAPLLPEKLYDRLQSVVRRCTVHNTLTHAPEITFEISSGRPQMVSS